MYTSHRIPDSPGSPAPERPPAARRASESGGGRENRLEVAYSNCSRGTRRGETRLEIRKSEEINILDEWFLVCGRGNKRDDGTSWAHWVSAGVIIRPNFLAKPVHKMFGPAI